MPSTDDIHPGLVLRLINSHSIGALVGTLATVQTVDRSFAGDWRCTVLWQEQRKTHRGTFLRSHAVDLACFEVVNNVERAVAKQVSKAEARREARRAQLRPPFDEGEP